MPCIYPNLTERRADLFFYPFIEHNVQHIWTCQDGHSGAALSCHGSRCCQGTRGCWRTEPLGPLGRKYYYYHVTSEQTRHCKAK